MGANTELPRDVSIVWARPVPLHFHARYSAEARTYRYIILNRGSRSLTGAKLIAACRGAEVDFLAVDNHINPAVEVRDYVGRFGRTRPREEIGARRSDRNSGGGHEGSRDRVGRHADRHRIEPRRDFIGDRV